MPMTIPDFQSLMLPALKALADRGEALVPACTSASPLLVVHKIGVRIQHKYEIKRIDEDYFGQENY